MPDCVYLSRDMVRVDAGGSTCCGNTVDVHRCLSQDQSSEWCVPAKSFDGSLSAIADVDGKSSRISAVSCEQCGFKILPKVLVPITGATKSATRLAWEKIHYQSMQTSLSDNDAIVIDCRKMGYGDVICASWITEYYRREQKRVLLHATGGQAEMAACLGQEVVPECESMFSLKQTWSLDVISRLNADRLSNWCGTMGIEPRWKRPIIRIPEDDVLAASNIRSRHKRLAMFCPRSTHTMREWPPAYWNELAKLLAPYGFECLVFGDDDKYIDMEGSGVGRSWTLCAAIARECDVVVGIDSGPMHWCGTANAKCLSIMGPTTDGVFAHMDNVHCISVKKRVMPCVGCWLCGPYYDGYECDIGCCAMSNVTPDQVCDEVVRLVC